MLTILPIWKLDGDTEQEIVEGRLVKSGVGQAKAAGGGEKETHRPIQARLKTGGDMPRARSGYRVNDAMIVDFANRGRQLAN